MVASHADLLRQSPKKVYAGGYPYSDSCELFSVEVQVPLALEEARTGGGGE